MSILDSDYSTLTVMDNGKIKNRNLNEYNLLKYNKFNGERIIIELSDKCKVVETFNEGIFNVYYGELSMQIREPIELARRISFCMENKTDSAIKELLLATKKDQINKSYLNEILTPFNDRIRHEGEKIIIDNRFAVDSNGQAYFINDGTHFRLCIVVSNVLGLKFTASDELGEMQIDYKTIEIYFKVLFLLYPDKEDKVFYNQLPAVIQKAI